MNKKQLIVAWVVGIISSILFLAGTLDYAIQTYNEFAFPEAFHAITPILMIGSLLIYTLRDKKK